MVYIYRDYILKITKPLIADIIKKCVTYDTGVNFIEIIGTNSPKNIVVGIENNKLQLCFLRNSPVNNIIKISTKERPYQSLFDLSGGGIITSSNTFTNFVSYQNQSLKYATYILKSNSKYPIHYIYATTFSIYSIDQGMSSPEGLTDYDKFYLLDAYLNRDCDSLKKYVQIRELPSLAGIKPNSCRVEGNELKFDFIINTIIPSRDSKTLFFTFDTSN